MPVWEQRPAFGFVWKLELMSTATPLSTHTQQWLGHPLFDQDNRCRDVDATFSRPFVYYWLWKSCPHGWSLVRKTPQWMNQGCERYQSNGLLFIWPSALRMAKQTPTRVFMSSLRRNSHRMWSDTTTYSPFTNFTNSTLVFKLRTYNPVLPPSGKEKNVPVAGHDELFYAKI